MTSKKEAEIVINIWFVIDIETELCYNWLIKPYCIAGSDSERTNILKVLAETDYLTVGRNEFDKRHKIVFQNMTVEGQIPAGSINSELETNFDYYVSTLEKTLPKKFNFSGNILDPPVAVDTKISKNPLYVSTILMENEFGEIRPYTTEENKAWYNNEKRRLELDRESRNN
jgi:hypothetical protein